MSVFTCTNRHLKIYMTHRIGYTMEKKCSNIDIGIDASFAAEIKKARQFRENFINRRTKEIMIRSNKKCKNKK